MKTTAFLLAALAGFASLGGAQSNVTVPEGMENSYTGTTSFLWRSVAFRYQCVYDAQHLLNQNVNHPIEITRLRFRPINGAIDAGGQVYTGVTIKLSTAVTDSQTMDVTFANNVGLDELTVFQGDVTLLPTTGTTPNDHHIDITLQTPFIYNPENGPLLVDVDAPNAPSAPVPNMAASNNFLTQFARRCSTTTVGSPTGSLSGFAAAMKIDYNIPAGTAFAFEYGEGCYNNYVSFYEEFPAGTIDLGSGAAGSTNSYQAIPNSTGGYIVIPGSNQFFTPLSADLALGDDALSAALPLGFAFNYPGGSCTDVVVESNGNVWLQAPTHTGFIVSAGPQSLVSRGAVISAFYEDMDPSVATGGGSVHFDSDPANGVAYITWLNCPLYEATPTVPRPTNTVQVAIYSSGIFELRYQQLDTSVSWTRTTVGFSPGNSKLPPMSDITSVGSISTSTDLTGLTLKTDQRPVLGSTINLTTSEIPATSSLTFLFLSFIKNTAGDPLAALGMSGCSLYAGNLLATPSLHALGFGGPTVTVPLSFPNSPAFIGVSLAAQAASDEPGVNALGFITSNGLDLQLGNL